MTMPKEGDEPRTLDPNPVDQIKNEWALRHLGFDALARLRPPVTEKPPSDTIEGLDLGGKSPTPDVRVRSAATLRDTLKASFSERFENRLPEGARKVRTDALADLCRQFLATATPGDQPEHVKAMSRLLNQLGEAFDATRKEVETLAQLRADLRETLALVAPLTPAPGLVLVDGATEADLDDAPSRHQRILDTLADTEASPDALQQLSSEITALGVQIERARQRVEDRRLQKEKIEADALEVRLHPEALADALDTQRQAVAQALATLPLDDAALVEAGNKLELLRQAANALNEKTGKVVARRDEFRRQLDTAVASLKGSSLIDPSVLEDKRVACAKLLENIQAEGEINKFPSELRKIRDLVGTAGLNAMKKDRQSGKKQLVEYLETELQALKLQALLLKGNPNADAKVVDGLVVQEWNTAYKVVTASKMPGTVDAVAKTLLDAVAKYREALERVRLGVHEKTATLAVNRDVLLSRIAKADPRGAVVEFTEPLEALREEVRVLLQDPLTKENVVKAGERASAFEAKWLAADKDIDDAAEVQACAGRVGKLYDMVLAQARQPVQAQLKAAHQAAEAAAARTGKVRDMAAARRLYAALEQAVLAAQDENETAGATKKTYLQSVTLGDAPIDGATLEAAYDLLGPAALKTLQQAKGGAKNIEAVCVALQSSGPAVKQFYVDALGGSAAAFAAVVGQGGGAQLKALAESFDDPADRRRLGTLVTSGGLAECPGCLADWLGDGVDPSAAPEEQAERRRKNGDRLKALGTAFSDKAGPAALKGLLVDAGLGARPSKDKPGVMIELLKSGFDGDSAQLRDFAKAYAGPENAVPRKNLKTLVDKSGFGDHPRTLGPLVKSIGVDRLNSLGEAFAAPADAAKLRALLASGGMSGDTSEVGHEHEHPDTLTKVYVDGFKSSPSDLKKFATAFQGHPGQCKEMLDAWNEFPSGKAKHRQPGRQIAKLMSKQHFDGDPAKLQTTFTTKIQQVPLGKRKLALRMAPYFDSERGPDPGKQPANIGKDCQLINDYILERHSPKHAQKGLLDGRNSYFPSDTDDSKLVAIITEALNHPNAPAPGESKIVPCPTAGLTVEIARKPNGNICHCYPTVGPPPPDPNEIASFTKDEATAILEAVK